MRLLETIKDLFKQGLISLAQFLCLSATFIAMAAGLPFLVVYEILRKTMQLIKDTADQVYTLAAITGVGYVAIKLLGA